MNSRFRVGGWGYICSSQFTCNTFSIAWHKSPVTHLGQQTHLHVHVTRALQLWRDTREGRSTDARSERAAAHGGRRLGSWWWHSAALTAFLGRRSPADEDEGHLHTRTGGHQRSRAARARGLRSRAEREKRTSGLLVCEGCVERPDPSSWDCGRRRGWYRRRGVAGPMKWVQRRRAATVRRAGRLVLCTVASLAFGEYAGSSSTAGRARQVFCRSLCRPVRVSPTRGTRPVLASPAPPPRCRSITLVRRNDPTGRRARFSAARCAVP